MPPGPSHANQNLYHLRRIPPNKCRSDPSRGVEATLILLDTFTKFGRNPEKCDVVLTSSVFSSSNMISRDHADIIGVKGASGRIEKYQINDRSLNGTYINDQRVNSTMQIMEGDVIKFGHMNGAAVRPGQTAPQANAEFAFMVERANPNYDYIGFVDGRRVRPVTCSGDTDYCTEIEGRTIEHGDVARPTVMQSTKASHVQNVPQNLTSPSTSSSTVSSTAGANPMAGLMWPGTLGYNQSIPGFTYSGFPVNPAYLQPPQWAQHLQVLHQQAQQSGFRVPDVFGATACMGPSNGPPSTSASLFPLAQRAGFSLQNNPLVNSLLTTAATPVTNHQQSNQQQIQHITQQQTQTTTLQEEKPSADSNPAHVKGSEAPSSEPASAAVSATSQVSNSTVAKVPVASPPMECDSSVPSPPKTTISISSSSTVIPSSTALSRPSSSPLRREEDVRSERSFVESPQPPRAPAPAPWDSTPSPRPRDYSPDRESTATRDTEKERDLEKEKEQREQEKEKEKETKEPKEKKDKKDKKKTSKEARPAVSTQPKQRTKTNEIARLLEDLCEGSWVNTVRRVSSTSRRPTDEAIIERNSRKEKKRMEKNRKKEHDREARATQESRSPISSGATPSSAKPRKRLKQLSDDSCSSGSSSEAEEVVQQPPPRKAALAAEKKKKVEMQKKSRIVNNVSDVSSDRSSDSGSESEEQLSSRKGRKRRFPSAERKSAEKKKASAVAPSSTSAKKKGKVDKKRKSTPVEEEKIEKEKVSEKPLTEEELEITQHDPTTTCALGAECTKPQNEQVGWIFCDDCEKWFHNICILGREDAPDEEFFYCGCKTKRKTKKR